MPTAAREATKVWIWPEPPNGAGANVNARAPVVGTLFTWDGDVIAEDALLRLDGVTDWTDTTCWHYEPEGFRPLAKRTSAAALFPIVTDHLGTPQEMFNEDGRFTWSARFTTWGFARTAQAACEAANDDGQAIYPRGGGTRGSLELKSTLENIAFDCPVRFQGQWADRENGLIYNRFRYYDAISVQYATPDQSDLAAE